MQVTRDPHAMAEITGRTFDAVNLLLANSAAMQSFGLECFAGSRRDINFLKEFCTVKVGGPRRSGHSTAAHELIRLFGKENVIVVTHTLHAGDQYDVPHKASPQSLARVRGVGPVKAVIVDVVSVISKNQLDEIYRTCAPCLGDIPSFFVLLE